MKHTLVFAIVCLASATLSMPQVLLAQRGRGGGAGAGNSGRGSGAPSMSLPPSPGRAPSVPHAEGRGHGSPDMTQGVGRQSSAVARIENNPGLSSRIQPLLPPGSNLQSSAAGFKNEGEFVSALHASKNLNIPFDQLKAKMTGDDRQSLGKAIQSLRPEMDKRAVKDSVKRAESLSKSDIREAKDNGSGHSGRRTAIGSEIEGNAKLRERLTPMLPDGMTFSDASRGFRNTGQFVSTLHVAKNLGIQFGDLRARMIAGGESLGEAIHTLRPEMSAAQVDAGVESATRASETDLRAGAADSASARPE